MILDSNSKLFETLSQLMKKKGECAFKIINELNISELTLRQIEYLKKFDQCDGITTSKLAEVLDLSKPSITEMIKKFIKLDCVYKEKCPQDGRVYYIHLTEKGKCIARLEELAIKRLVGRITTSLNDDEIDILSDLLLKIK